MELGNYVVGRGNILSAIRASSAQAAASGVAYYLGAGEYQVWTNTGWLAQAAPETIAISADMIARGGIK